MRLMRILAVVVGGLLLAGEFARRGMDAAVEPRAIDDLAAGILLVALGLLGRRVRPGWHAAGWGLFTGVILATLGLNLDALLAAADKPRAGLYVAVLGLMLVVGLMSAGWWARRR